MKKTSIFLAIAFAMIAMVSCKPKPEPVEAGYDLATIFTEDSTYVRDSIVKDTVPFYFYEATVVLNNPVDSNVYHEAIYVQTIFQYKDTVITITHDTNCFDSMPNIRYDKGFWCEDMPLGATLNMSINEAISFLHKANNDSSLVAVPHSSLVVYRKPLSYPEPVNPYYIFGQMSTGFAAVDAVTGEVKGILSVELTESCLNETTK